MSRLCDYQDSLGIPGREFHTHILNIGSKKIDVGFAYKDLIGTVVIAWVIAKLSGTSFLKSFILLAIFSTILHWLFCVDTTLLTLLKKVF